jgi:uncharacterized membrane protein
MERTIVALFEKVEDAENAVEELKRAGIPDEKIGLVTKKILVDREPESTKTFSDVAKSTGAGAVGGGVIGGTLGTLIGIGALTIPGLGPAFAAGTLAVTLASAAAGAGAGAATGGIIGALIGLSIPEKDAQVYAEGVKRGGLLLSVETDEARLPLVGEIMKRSNALDVDTLRREWEANGWTGYDENSDAEEDQPLRYPPHHEG